MSDPLTSGTTNRRIVFMGSPEFALPSLIRLATTHEICAVYSQPAKKSGRGMKSKHVPVASHAINAGLPLFTPDNLQSPEIVDQLTAHRADIFVVVAYGLLLPPAVLAIPRFGCLNGHASLLPRWRGAAPIQRAIEAGDGETGVSAMLMEAGLDTGPVVNATKTEIRKIDTAATLHDRLADLTADCLGTIVDRLPTSITNAQPQPTNGVCYAAKISPTDAKICWKKPARELDFHIRAFSPYPGAWCEGPKGRLRILAAEPVALPDAASVHDAGCFLGKNTDGALLVRCGDAAMAITMLQPAGKKPMPSEAFLNGVSLSVGDIFAAAQSGRTR